MISEERLQRFEFDDSMIVIGTNDMQCKSCKYKEDISWTCKVYKDKPNAIIKGIEACLKYEEE